MGSNVDSIKERLDIVEVVSSYVKLERTGVNLKGKCPFHNEKTASFFVSPTRQSFYCFGCGVKGDMFTFVQEIEGMDFRGALKLLADKAGVELHYEKWDKKTEKDELYAVIEEAAKFFEGELEKEPQALDYLRFRGVERETVKTWRLGYAPEKWRSLYGHLTSVGLKSEVQIKAGLVKRKEDKGDPYDIFRGRIIFPIADMSGRIIAFSGRALGKDIEPKYLNTSETALFLKGETLYGLPLAKEEIRKKDYTVLVEGQVDLILSHQAGVKNSVASSGTAFTRAHLERLKRLSSRIILAFDGDEAGERAAYKSALLALSLGLDVKIAGLKGGKDPADLIREDPNLWKNLLREAEPAIDYFLRLVIERERDSRKQGKEINKKILPLIALLQSAIERSHFVAQVSKRAGIKEELVWEDLRQLPESALLEALWEEGAKGDNEERKILPRKSYIERRLMGIILWQETLAEPSVDAESLKEEIKKKIGEEYYQTLCQLLEAEKESLVFEAESHYGDPKKLSDDIAELLINLTDDLLRRELANLVSSLLKAEAAKDSEEISRLSLEVKRIHQEMRALEEKKRSDIV